MDDEKRERRRAIAVLTFGLVLQVLSAAVTVGVIIRGIIGEAGLADVAAFVAAQIYLWKTREPAEALVRELLRRGGSE